MVFEFSDEQQALRDAVRSFLAAASPESAVREVADGALGYDPSVWKQLSGDLGLTGLAVPAEYGGAGAGAVETAIVLEEMGRSLFPGPYLSTVLAAAAIAASDDTELQREFLPALADGELIGTVAVAERSGRWDADAIDTTATETPDGWAVRGSKHYVTDGSIADVAVVAARGPGGVALFLVRCADPAVTRTAVTGFDITRRLATLEFAGAPARALRADTDLFAHLHHLALVSIAAEQAGAARAAFDMAVAYAKDRVQFGRAIGSFQAIKHMLADALLDVESATSAAYYAAWAAAENSDELPTVAPLAKAFCSDTLVATAAMNIQVHGGIAFTWEHPAHLYQRRARSSAQLWGSPEQHRDALAGRLGL